jgi:hypothetical protein
MQNHKHEHVDVQGYALQNSFLGQPHSDGGVVSIVSSNVEDFCRNALHLNSYALPDIIKNTKMAPFQVVLEAGQ